MREEVPDPADIELDVQSYEACGGTEHFLSYEDSANDLLVGFCRLRFPNDPVRRELKNAALVRELHVYGNEVGVGETSGDGEAPRASNASSAEQSRSRDGDAVSRDDEDGRWPSSDHSADRSSGRTPREDGETASDYQHEGYGRRLLREAEDLAADAGFEKLSVISGIGAREYYRQKLGYYQDGPYVSKQL